MCAGHVWRKKVTIIKTVVVEEPIGKRPALRWENCVKRDIKAVDLGVNWKEVAEDRERDGGNFVVRDSHKNR